MPVRFTQGCTMARVGMRGSHQHHHHTPPPPPPPQHHRHTTDTTHHAALIHGTPHTLHVRWLAFAVVIAGYVHDKHDFIPEPTQWVNRLNGFPYVVELLAGVPRHRPVIHAIMERFVLEKDRYVDAWYQSDRLAHTALELWGGLDTTSSPVGAHHVHGRCMDGAGCR